jgi:hypothetical protein
MPEFLAMGHPTSGLLVVCSLLLYIYIYIYIYGHTYVCVFVYVCYASCIYVHVVMHQDMSFVCMSVGVYMYICVCVCMGVYEFLAMGHPTLGLVVVCSLFLYIYVGYIVRSCGSIFTSPVYMWAYMCVFTCMYMIMHQNMSVCLYSFAHLWKYGRACGFCRGQLGLLVVCSHLLYIYVCVYV